MYIEVPKHLTKMLSLAIPVSVFAALVACQQPKPDNQEPAASPALNLPPGVDVAAEAINEVALKEHIATLSSDEFEGRSPASPGDEKARQYLQDTMAAMGLEPGELHRIATMASGCLDSLPHSGTVVALFMIMKMTHREGYKDLGIVTVVMPLLATLITIGLASIF
jgi:hypothetical protein